MRPRIVSKLRIRRPSTVRGWLLSGLTVAAIVSVKLVAGTAFIAGGVRSPV